MEIILNYIVPNIVLFGSIYLFGKTIENTVWYTIENYDKL